MLTLFLSCQKYEEGPAFSLRSAENKLTGLWEITELIVDDINYTSTYKDTLNANLLIANFDGLYASIVRNSAISSQFANSKLELVNNKKEMELNFTSQNIYIDLTKYLFDRFPVLLEKNNWQIIKLTFREFKIKLQKDKTYSIAFQRIKE